MLNNNDNKKTLEPGLLDRLLNHQGFKKYFFNTSWLMAENILRLVAGLVVGVWVARYLGPQQFGVFSYALAFTAIFAGIAKLGLDEILIREIVNKPEKLEVYMGTAFWLKMLGALLVMAILAIAIQFSSNDSTTNMYIFIVASGLVFQSFEVIDFYFRSQVLARFVSICKVVQLILSSLVKIVLILNGAKLFWFVLVILFDAITLSISFFIAYFIHKKNNFYKYFDLHTAKKLLKNSWPLIFSSLVVMIYMRIDQIMVKEILGEHEVGVYSAAIKLSEIWYFIPILISSSLFPSILNAKKVSKTFYYQRLQNLYFLVVWLSIPLALATTFLARPIILMLYGDAFIEGGQVLMIHVWTGVFVSLGVSSGKWLLAENLVMLSFWRTFCGLLINLVLNYFMIPKYGINGAAVATLISQVIATYVYDFFNSKTREMFWMKTKALLMIRSKKGFYLC